MIDRATIDLLLERGVQFKMPAPRCLRWMGVKGIKLRIMPLYLGTILEIRRLRDEASELEVQAEVVALAVLNHPRRIRWFRRWLTRYLIRYVRSDSLFELFAIVQALNRDRDFMTLTNWAALVGEEVMRPTEVRGS